MAFSIRADLGDKKPYFRFDKAAPAETHVAVVIDDKRIGREHAARLLRAIADRLQECDWPPDEACTFARPRETDRKV